MSAASGTAVYLEIGPHRTFAAALDWPGWCRSGRGEKDALEQLAAYAKRYAHVAARAKLTVPRAGTAKFAVVERLDGTAITDFGAPVVMCTADSRALDAAAAQRLAALLGAAWEELAAVAATAPAALRKGPRGGGRDREAIIEHVVEAERSYARKIDVRLNAQEWRDGGVALLRERILATLSRLSRGRPSPEKGWPPHYFTRRTAWHALDHAWEIEDRSS